MGQTETKALGGENLTTTQVVEMQQQQQQHTSSPLKDSKNSSSRRRIGSLDSNHNDSASQAASLASSRSLGRVARAPLSWAAAGAERVASTTAATAVSTLNAALKTASVLASTTEAAGNVVAKTTTNVAINTANAATKTGSLITSATNAGAIKAGDAIAGTATLVVEGMTVNASPRHILESPQDGRMLSPGSMAGQAWTATTTQAASRQYFQTVGGGKSGHPSDIFIPEAVALGTTFGAGKKSSSQENLPLEVQEQKSAMRNVGSKFWCMLGATNVSARRQWVANVTSSKSTPPSAKYMRKIVTLAWETKGQSVDELYKFLQPRPILTSSNCALKALITCLRLTREGPPEALMASIANVGSVDAIGAWWAEKVLDVSFAEQEYRSNSPLQQETLPAHDNVGNTLETVGGLHQQLLIARFSALIVQKMHFHSCRRGFNARYEFQDASSSPLANTSSGGIQSSSSSSLPGFSSSPGNDVTRLRFSVDDEDVEEEDPWEREIQIASALLTMLGTIEGVTRLALGMGGEQNFPSPPALALSSLLIEEAMGVFDCLSTTLCSLAGHVSNENHDIATLRSLFARYQESYMAIQLYCSAALEFPYVVALKHVPDYLVDEPSPLSKKLNSTKSSGSTSVSISSPTSGLAHAMMSSPSVGNGYNNSGSKQFASATISTLSTLGFGFTSRLTSKQYTRLSVLECLVDEEGVQYRFARDGHTRTVRANSPAGSSQTSSSPPSAKTSFATNAMSSNFAMSGNDIEIKQQTSPIANDKKKIVKKNTTPQKQSSSSLSSRTSTLHVVKQEQMAIENPASQIWNPWGTNSDDPNSVENARPPANFSEDEFMFQERNGEGGYDDDDEDDERNGNISTEGDSEDPLDDDNDMAIEVSKQVRTRTTGNPFDTGNSSVVLLAEAHRSAFSTINNPFASGQFNAFATQTQFPSKHSSQARFPIAARQEDATKRALEQCVRSLEFSGIKLNPSDVEITGEIIGRGAFSVVFRGKLMSTGAEVAVKELQLEEWGRSPEMVLDFRAEVALMKAVHHPNVLQLIGACTEPNLRLVSEFCHRGNLFDLMYNDRASHPISSKVLSWPLRIRLSLGEARGMHFLHTAFPAPLIHRDLKSLNLLLSKSWTLKVSDFGLSRFRRKGVHEGVPCGTTQWMAPEVIQGKDYDESADVYSFGVNLWELATRRVPWEGNSEVKKTVVGGGRPLLDTNVLDRGCPESLIRLIGRCWAQNAEDRPDFGTIVTELKAIAKELARDL